MSGCKNKCNFTHQIIGDKKVSSCSGCYRVWEQEIPIEKRDNEIILPPFPPNNPPYLDLADGANS